MTQLPNVHFHVTSHGATQTSPNPLFKGGWERPSTAWCNADVTKRFVQTHSDVTNIKHLVQTQLLHSNTRHARIRQSSPYIQYTRKQGTTVDDRKERGGGVSNGATSRPRPTQSPLGRGDFLYYNRAQLNLQGPMFDECCNVGKLRT